MPRLSVLMVSYNAGRYLQLAVDDVLQQSYRDLELVLVDNGSSDGSVTSLLEQVRDPRLKVIHAGENLGPYKGAALGSPACQGELLARMDADDRTSPRRFSLQVDALDADPSLAAVSCFWRRIDEDGRVFATDRGPAAPEDIQRRARFNMPVLHPGLLMRRSLLERVPYRTEMPYCSDYDFVARAVDEHRIAALPLPLHDYRRHGGSISTTKRLFQLALRCVVRMVTFRRHAGKEERLDDEVAWARTAAEQLSSRNDILLDHAERLRREGAHTLAAWTARKAFTSDLSMRGVLLYADAAVHGLRDTPKGLRRLARRVLATPALLLEETDDE